MGSHTVYIDDQTTHSTTQASISAEMRSVQFNTLQVQVQLPMVGQH